MRPLNNGAMVVEELKVVRAWMCLLCEDRDENEDADENENGKGAFIRKDVTDVRRHVNVVHGASARDAYVEIKAQSWFGGRWAVYWKVDLVLRLGMEEGEGKEVGEDNWPKLGTEFGPSCVWAMFGAGWGDRKPRAWVEWCESEKEKEMGIQKEKDIEMG